MMNDAKRRYAEIAGRHTQAELCGILGVHDRTIRRYALETGVKPKPTIYRNYSLNEYEARFKDAYDGRIEMITEPVRVGRGKVKAICRCLACGAEWQADIGAKLRDGTGCISCDKGNHGNKYSREQAEEKLNAIYQGQWEIIRYGKYSEKDSVIRCTLCGNKMPANISDFVNTTTMRCPRCQTGSFGEYVIANVLLRNGIPFDREKRIDVDGRRYRLDFLVDGRIGIEYSGAQHFQPGPYYDERINEGVRVKKDWCIRHGYAFEEIEAAYDVDEIIARLSKALGVPLERPSPAFFRSNNPGMAEVLGYMETHSARQAMARFGIPDTKIERYVKLDGYRSISDWQSDNRRT